MGVLKANVSGSWVDITTTGPAGPAGAAGLPFLVIGHVANFAALPAVGTRTDGDVYITDDTGRAWQRQPGGGTPLWKDCGQWKGDAGSTGPPGPTAGDSDQVVLGSQVFS